MPQNEIVLFKLNRQTADGYNFPFMNEDSSCSLCHVDINQLNSFATCMLNQFRINFPGIISPKRRGHWLLIISREVPKQITVAYYYTLYCISARITLHIVSSRTGKILKQIIPWLSYHEGIKASGVIARSTQQPIQGIIVSYGAKKAYCMRNCARSQLYEIFIFSYFSSIIIPNQLNLSHHRNHNTTKTICLHINCVK